MRLNVLAETKFGSDVSDEGDVELEGRAQVKYKLHENMMEYVNASIYDADVLLFITDTQENEMNHQQTLEKIKKVNIEKYNTIIKTKKVQKQLFFFVKKNLLNYY